MQNLRRLNRIWLRTRSSETNFSSKTPLSTRISNLTPFDRASSSNIFVIPNSVSCTFTRDLYCSYEFFFFLFIHSDENNQGNNKRGKFSIKKY